MLLNTQNNSKIKFKIINGLQISEITLGTAQFGSKYGISNKTGKISDFESEKILNDAVKSGITTFDTAPNYGTSQQVLGNYFAKSHFPRTVITKIPKIETKSNNSKFEDVFYEVKAILKNSKKSLNDEIQICLLHDPKDIHSNDGFVVDSLIRLKKDGIIKMIGVSTYSPEDVNDFLNIQQFDTIELPVNIFDTRLIKNGLIQKLNEFKKTIFARSVFLQGLFFIPANELPVNLKFAKHELVKLQKLSNKFQISILDIVFGFVHQIDEISSIILGVENSSQLNHNLRLLKSKPLSDELLQSLDNDFSNISEKLINPTYWKSM
jgi:aryl-alcohol dehydrogenase-like predicted oxidoreductase